MKVIITGGAGFIGSNAARRHLARGDDVVLVDNLSRHGSEANLSWLRGRDGKLVFERQDIRDRRSIERIFDEHRDAEQPGPRGPV